MEEQKNKRTKKTAEKKEKPSIVADVKEKKAESQGLIAVVRIAGEVEIKKEIVNTLYRLRLRRKYSCTLIDSKNMGLMGMLNKVRHQVAFGEIDEEMLVRLLNARGQKVEKASLLDKSNENSKKAAKTVNYEEAASELMNGKTLTELGFKGFFRLHPPRKGIKSKQIYPKGVLGNHKKDINKLIERML